MALASGQVSYPLRARYERKRKEKPGLTHIHSLAVSVPSGEPAGDAGFDDGDVVEAGIPGPSVLAQTSAPDHPTGNVGGVGSGVLSSHPLQVGDGLHTQWRGVFVRTATCDGCESRGNAVLQRCTARGCGVQLCHGCVQDELFDTSTHRVDDSVSWVPPSRAPRRRRGRGRGGQSSGN